MKIVCPHCGSMLSATGEIPTGSKVHCRSCRNKFAFLPEQHTLVVSLDDDKPPPRVAPFSVAGHAQPSRPRRGGIKAIEASRKSTAVMLAIGLLGLLGVFINWYVSTVRSFTTHYEYGSKIRATTIDNIAKANSIRLDAKPKSELKKPDTAFLAPLTRSAMPANGSLAQRYGSTIVQQPGPALTTPADGQQQAFRESTSMPPATQLQALVRPQGAPIFGGSGQPSQAFGQPENSDPVNAVARPKRLSPEEAKKAASKLFMAKRLLKEGKSRLASRGFRELVELYPDSKEAKEARSLMDESADTRSDKAQEKLTRAEGLEKLGSLDAARAEYQGIISRYPDTGQAEKAKQRLKALGTM